MRKTILASALALLAGLAPAALLNIKPSYPLITAVKNKTATVIPLSYNATTDQFLVSSMPVSVQFFAGDTFHMITGTKALTITATIDSTGALVSGTFTLTGMVSNGTTTYGPNLLTGNLTAFGFLNQGATDLYDFRATVTGGDLAPLYAGKDIGLSITSENSTFNNSFAVNFNGGAKVNTGSIAGPNNGSIGDFVWNDTNRNGIQDAGEPGINGVTVELLDSSMNVIATQVTHLGPLGQNGYYQFTGLAAGDYYVRVVSSTVPAGFVASPVGAGGDTTVDSNPPLAPVNLPTNASSDQTIDFGYYLPATGRIGNYVWNDANRDGIQNDGPSAGLDGVTVRLLDANTNAVLQTTTTAGGGAYIFEGLSAGNYKVEVDLSTLPPGMVASPTEQGADRAVDSNVNGGIVNLPTDSSEDLTIDFGYNSPCSGAIGDRVWNDLNRNGIQDAGEPGLVGIPVMLYSSDGGTLLQTTATGVDGIYMFNGVCAGTYQVKVDETSLPPGFVPTPSLQGGDTTVDSNGSPATVTLPTDSSTDVTIDFGYQQPATGTIGDFVWNDLDADGVQDAGEPGIDGVTLYLYDASHVRIATEITHDGGQYLFTGLTAGSYTVEIEPSTLPAGFVASPTGAGGDTAKDSNPLPAPVILPTDSSSDITIDFGYYEQFPAIVIVKYTNGQDANLPPGPSIPVGAAVNWEYVVTNIGNVPLTSVTVTDDHGVAVTCPKTSLAPAESMTCTASGVAVAGQYANIGSVTGTPPIGPPVTDENPSHYYGVLPGISIVKYTNGQDADLPPGPSIPVGGAVSWTYVVTNTGNVSLDFVAVTDNMGVAVTCPKASLAVGESMTCTASGVAVAGQYANIGTATGIPPVGSSVTASNPSHYYGVVAAPALTITKTPSKTNPIPGESVTYTYVVTNTGNVPLGTITVTDDNGTPYVASDDVTIGTVTGLVPGASATLTRTMIPSQVIVVGSLGSAGPSSGFAVLSMGGDASHTTAGINCSNATVVGDIGVASYGTITWAGACLPLSTHLTGNVYVGTNVTVDTDLTSRVIVDETRMNHLRDNALYASGYYQSLPSTPSVQSQFPANGSVGSNLTITGTPGINVVNLPNFALNANLTFTGPPGTQFVINIAGSVDFHSGSVSMTGGVGTWDVVFNAYGTPASGATFKSAMACNAAGLILAYYLGGNAMADWATGNLELIGGYNQVITLMSGTELAPPTAPPPTVTNTAKASTTYGVTIVSATTTATVTIN